jgi:hypothetical protein
MLSSPSPREGERQGEEWVADLEDVVEVAVVEEDDGDEPIEVIPVPEPPPRRLVHKKMAWIWISPRGRPTGTLAPWTGAREADRVSSETRSVVWPPPPPSPPRGTDSTVTLPPPPPQDPTIAIESPPLQSPIGGRILRWFAHLANPSSPGHHPGAWDHSHQP